MSGEWARSSTTSTTGAPRPASSCSTCWRGNPCSSMRGNSRSRRTARIAAMTGRGSSRFSGCPSTFTGSASPDGSWKMRKHATRRQHTNEFREVLADIARADVLQHEKRVDEVDGAGRDRLEPAGGVDAEFEVWSYSVKPFRHVDHRRSDIDTDHVVEISGQGVCEPPRPAAKVQRASSVLRQAALVQVPDQRIDLVAPCLQELVDRPPVPFLVRRGEDRPERVASPVLVPVAAQRAQAHGAQCNRRLSSPGSQRLSTNVQECLSNTCTFPCSPTNSVFECLSAARAKTHQYSDYTNARLQIVCAHRR